MANIRTSFFALLLLCSLFATSVWAGTYSGGTGEPNSPYKISVVADWQELMIAPSDWDKYFILTADLNLAGITITPVGTSDSNCFTGVFDGQGFVIRNAVINEPNSDIIGIFGEVNSDGQIRNLGIENVNITGRTFVGGLVGWNGGTLTSCYATGSVSGTTQYSYNANIGGLVGENDGSITFCYATGSVTGSERVGGLVGWNYTGTLISCYATGSVSGNYDVGGLVGWNHWKNSSLTSCYATGSVSGTSGVGGLVGENEGSITSCYSTGSVSGNSYVGGLVGFNEFGGWIDSCFWDIQTSGQTYSAGGTGKTTAEMQTLVTYLNAGWDFFGETANGTADTWRMCEDGIDYPKLRWQYAFQGDVNWEDLLYLCQRWLQTTANPCEGADITGDGVVNFKDYAILAGNWTGEISPPFPPADYYIDPNGNDSNLGTSPEQAWKTIQKAANTVQAGKTVLVMPGTYAEQVTTVNAGTSGSPITYRGWYETGQVIINATGNAYGFKNTKAYVILVGFEVRNANQNGILFSNDSGDNCIIRNCISHNNGTNGIRIDSSDNCLIENCLIYNNTADGVEVTGNADTTYFNNCTIYGNGKDGIGWSTSDGTVNNCIIINNGWWGLSSYGTMTINVYYSDIWNNTKGHYDNTSKIIEGGNCIHSDPMFIAPSSGDFNLQSGSPCKNTASDGGDVGYR